jgi:hypothetical protein
LQAIAVGQVGSLSAAREILRNSVELKHYQPTDVQLWQQQYENIEQEKIP